MKNAIATCFRCLLICATLWTTQAIAGDVQYKIETFHDESAALEIEQISNSNFTPNTGEIRKSYQKGNFWLRISVANINPELILYFENPAIDEATLFLENKNSTPFWNARKISLQDLLHGKTLKDMNGEVLHQPVEIYLQIKTSSAKQFNVMLLSAKEAQIKEYTKYAVLSSQITAAIILMIWVAMQNWLARSKIFFTVMLSAPLFVLSRLNYFGFFLNEANSSSWVYLSLNMVLFLTLISGGTLMVKESFGRLFNKKQNQYFYVLFACSLLPSLGLIFDIPRAHLVMCSLLINSVMVASLIGILFPIFKSQRHLFWHYKFQLIIFVTYALMSTLPGFYFVAPQLFPFTLGIPTYRDFFYPVLAFLIMALMLNEQQEKEMDSIFNMAVTKANADLEIEKNKKQHVFLGMLLHEIKTPLSVIKFGAAALATDAPKTQLWTTRVDAAADAINHILDQCLLADKYEFGLSGYKEEHVNISFEISKLVERVSYLNANDAERIECQFSPDLPTSTSAYVDPVFFRSIFENLVTNALKYSAAHSKIHINVAIKIHEGAEVIDIEIKNQIGKVGPPQLDKIFSRYYRAEGAQGYSGTGLGLWLANQQAKEMGSSIHCSFDDIWTTFSFQLRKSSELS